jgi:hypothetical protein
MPNARKPTFLLIVRHHATWNLQNSALQTKLDYHSRMAIRRFTPLLKSILAKDTMKLQLIAIRVLWALSMDCSAAREVVRLGGLDPLTYLLKEGRSPSNDHRLLALSALQGYAVSNRASLTETGLVKQLLSVARFGNRFVSLLAQSTHDPSVSISLGARAFLFSRSPPLGVSFFYLMSPWPGLWRSRRPCASAIFRSGIPMT